MRSVRGKYGQSYRAENFFLSRQKSGTFCRTTRLRRSDRAVSGDLGERVCVRVSCGYWDKKKSVRLLFCVQGGSDEDDDGDGDGDDDDDDDYDDDDNADDDVLTVLAHFSKI